MVCRFVGFELKFSVEQDLELVKFSLEVSGTQSWGASMLLPTKKKT
jgi:hypothetical protein